MSRLAVAVVIGLSVWLGILPRLLAWGPIAAHVAAMEMRQVDPAAMYYTELERLPLRPEWIEDRLVLWPWRSASGGATLARRSSE